MCRCSANQLLLNQVHRIHQADLSIIPPLSSTTYRLPPSVSTLCLPLSHLHLHLIFTTHSLHLVPPSFQQLLPCPSLPSLYLLSTLSPDAAPRTETSAILLMLPDLLSSSNCIFSVQLASSLDSGVPSHSP